MTISPQIQEPIAVRFRPADRLVLKAAADSRGETLSAYIRRVTLTAAHATLEAEMVVGDPKR